MVSFVASSHPIAAEAAAATMSQQPPVPPFNSQGVRALLDWNQFLPVPYYLSSEAARGPKSLWS